MRRALLILGLLVLTGCVSSPTASITPPLPAAPANLVRVVSSAPNEVVAPTVPMAITSTWQDYTPGSYYTGLRGTNYLMEPFTNAPVIYKALAQISNSFTLTSTNQAFYVIAFNTNL